MHLLLFMPLYINEWYTTCFLEHQMMVRRRELRRKPH